MFVALHPINSTATTNRAVVDAVRRSLWLLALAAKSAVSSKRMKAHMANTHGNFSDVGKSLSVPKAGRRIACPPVDTLAENRAGLIPSSAAEVGETRHVPPAGTPEQPSETVPTNPTGTICKL